MMRTLAFTLGLALAAPSEAQQPSPAPRLPQDAAGQALMACVAHSMGMAPITAENASALVNMGLRFAPSYPSHLNARANNQFGQGSFAESPSTEGQIWLTGYDGGTCILSTVGTPAGPIMARLQQLFAIPGSWKPEKIKQLPGSRWSQFGWKVRPDLKLIAQVAEANLPANSPARGFVQVTVAPTAKRKR